MRVVELKKENDFWKGSFMSMASPCDVLMEVDDKSLAQNILTAVADEAWRIEDKFSRYKKNNIIFQINNSSGEAVVIDEEVTRLLNFANELFEISEGLFDVTSGVLRQVWKFDGSANLPNKKDVKKIVKKVGWQKVSREGDSVALPEGMEIDLGGIGKEYAVDRCVQIARNKKRMKVCW